MVYWNLDVSRKTYAQMLNDTSKEVKIGNRFGDSEILPSGKIKKLAKYAGDNQININITYVTWEVLQDFLNEQACQNC
ncbi:MAG: Unknown protein [uncultured Sulfurovum sp.]|uniref:Uncharacterized protein n=1 Tax=uncultured Sulfurovum sp. TaxID=269237 RepID=A0A6S6SGB5_9BACT|nr:MAG: Unknown protein [uncultured Sulfurovum sp.]